MLPGFLKLQPRNVLPKRFAEASLYGCAAVMVSTRYAISFLSPAEKTLVGFVFLSDYLRLQSALAVFLWFARPLAGINRAD